MWRQQPPCLLAVKILFSLVVCYMWFTMIALHDIGLQFSDHPFHMGINNTYGLAFGYPSPFLTELHTCTQVSQYPFICWLYTFWFTGRNDTGVSLGFYTTSPSIYNTVNTVEWLLHCISKFSYIDFEPFKQWIAKKVLESQPQTSYKDSSLPTQKGMHRVTSSGFWDYSIWVQERLVLISTAGWSCFLCWLWLYHLAITSLWMYNFCYS